MQQFLDNHMNNGDPNQMTAVVLPYSDGGEAKRAQMALEGKIIQGISLDNVMVRFGDRGGVRASDCRIVHSLMYGTPTLSWMHIVMMNTWITREASQRRFIPYARLISAMIIQQNCLPPESLWVSKPLEEFNIAYMKKNWKIDVNLAGNKYVVTDRLGHKYEFLNPDAQQGDEEMYDEEDETEPDGPRGPQQRYMRRHREINADVAGFVKQRQGPTFRNYNRGQQACYDNISACIELTRENSGMP
ncbi:hypothetical protein Hanom_Chr15g01340161 [Helianthus anomalus]